MSGNSAERRDGSVDLAAGGIRVRAGFRVLTEEPLAGGPIELEFFVEAPGPEPLQLAVAGDRMRGRPGQISITATLDGTTLEDPAAGTPDMGGPIGVVAVTPDQPWRQRLVLNDFVRLERATVLLAPGATGRLEFTCRRPIVLAATAAAALSPKGAEDVTIELAIDLRRDDDALADSV